MGYAAVAFLIVYLRLGGPFFFFSGLALNEVHHCKGNFSGCLT